MITMDQALERLLAGNKRFVGSRMTHPRQNDASRVDLIQGQRPFAVILGCSDSRVPPEIIFDQGLGDLFVIRVAGNGLAPMVLGSLEYAVEHLHVPLILVLGHSLCGAVTAAAQEADLPGELPAVTRGLQPALEQARNMPGDLIENTARIHARLVAEKISHSAPILSKWVESGRGRVLPAFYGLDTGKVEVLEVL
jgi:carbonic anhydrase